MERTLDLHYDTIVIGADLSALSFSYAQKVPFIYIRRLKPYKYGFDFDYEEKLKIYEHMFYMLSINRYCPLSDKVQSIRLDEENMLRVTTNTNCLIKIKYNKLIISDDYKVEGLPPVKDKTSYSNCVIDYFGIADTYVLKFMGDTSNDCPRTIYYPGTYVSGTKQFKNLIINSLLSDEELEKIDFSESYMRLRLYRIYQNMQTLQHIRREIYPLGKNIYEFPDNISILTDSHEKNLGGPKVEDRYLNFIESRLWKA